MKSTLLKVIGGVCRLLKMISGVYFYFNAPLVVLDPLLILWSFFDQFGVVSIGKVLINQGIELKLIGMIFLTGS